MTPEDGLWLREERSGRGPVPEYSRARITSAAVALADEGGLKAASMRKVAEALGTAPASLYRYVRTRDELVALMADQVTREYSYPSFTGSWLPDVLGLARQTLGIYLRHPWMLEVTAAGAPVGPAAVDFLEQFLGALAGVDVPGRTKLEAMAMMTGVVTLFARETLTAGRTTEAGQAETARYLMHVVMQGQHPHLAAALADQGEPAGEELFDRVVGRILTGLLGGA